eukprot:7391713-Prymnesium_polylepis.1
MHAPDCTEPRSSTMLDNLRSRRPSCDPARTSRSTRAATILLASTGWADENISSEGRASDTWTILGPMRRTAWFCVSRTF